MDGGKLIMFEEELFQIGDIVEVTHGAEKQSKAIVYEVYKDFDDESKHGVSLITSDGRDLGGWSYKEQVKYLKLKKRTGYKYNFSNVTKLKQDYDRGMFNDSFDMIKKKKVDGGDRACGVHCLMAKSIKCSCECGGVNHGIGLKQRMF